MNHYLPQLAARPWQNSVSSASPPTQKSLHILGAEISLRLHQEYAFGDWDSWVADGPLAVKIRTHFITIGTESLRYWDLLPLERRMTVQSASSHEG